MRSNYIVMLLCALLLGCNMSTTSYKPETRNVYIVNDSVKIYVDILLKPFKNELKNSLQYHWYSSGALGVNYGGFNGYLLDGGYKKLNFNGNLLEQGSFSNGLKDGVWKFWYSNGNLRRIENWSRGLIGKISEYDKDGVLVESKISTLDNQSRKDSTGLKTPWYKRLFKKGNKSSK